MTAVPHSTPAGPAPDLRSANSVSEPVEGFDTVLVANRGEIARRIIRTLRRLGIRSVAVYSDADARAPHVREADTAVRIGPAAARASYLDVDAVVAAATATGADAIHPGYGFLSESVALARACAAAGIVFVGPGERALEVMGDKIRARDHVAAHDVPIVPGFSGAGRDDDEILREAEALGFPLLVKPSAGGGGKGMEVVRRAAELPDAIASSRRVSAAAFGDDTLLFERLIEAPRHIEVQVLADDAGAVVHLGERECTLQRRHQKVIEESPSPLVDDRLRRALGDAACRAAASVDYRGAGTVEFLVPAGRPDDFFFIEMNTRLQVEHPVTELVTGTDLVEEQLRIAAGAPLRFAQDDVVLRGHAVEARVYAESPRRGFLPSTGTVLCWRAAPGVRTDTGVETGSVVTTDYDPMIAKVIVHGVDRRRALRGLDTALSETVVLGVDTNLDFLRSLAGDPRVVAGDLDTALLASVAVPPPAVPAPAALAAAGAALVRDDAVALPPWTTSSGWRAGGPSRGFARAFELDDGTVIDVDASVAASPSALVSAGDDGAVWVYDDGVTTRLDPLGRRRRTLAAVATRTGADSTARGALAAPLPGTVVAVHVADGDRVTAGERIATIEAMKMEHALTAPHDGTVHLRVAVGAQIARGATVADVDPVIEEDPS